MRCLQVAETLLTRIRDAKAFRLVERINRPGHDLIVLGDFFGTLKFRVFPYPEKSDDSFETEISTNVQTKDPNSI